MTFLQRISASWAQKRVGVCSCVESTQTVATSNTVLSNLELPRTYGRIFMIAERESPVNSGLSVRFATIGTYFYDRIQGQFDGLNF